jgi:hypothetical protein
MYNCTLLSCTLFLKVLRRQGVTATPPVPRVNDGHSTVSTDLQ